MEKKDEPGGLQSVIDDTRRYLYVATERLNKIREEKAKKITDGIGVYRNAYQDGEKVITLLS